METPDRNNKEKKWISRAGEISSLIKMLSPKNGLFSYAWLASVRECSSPIGMFNSSCPFFSSYYFFHLNSLLGQSLERLFWLNLIKFLPFMKWAQAVFSFQILRSQFWWLLIVWIKGLFLVGFVEKYVLFFI